MTFSASYDRTAQIISAFVCLVLLGAPVAIHQVVLLCVSLFVLLLVYAYSPRGYVLADREMLVKRLAGTVRMALDDVREVRTAVPEDFRGCKRLWGSGGMFGYYGLFSTTKLGKTTWYVTNRANSIVVITASKTVLISPGEPDRFLAAIHALAPRIENGIPAPATVERRRSSRLGAIVATGAALAALALVAAAITYSPGPPSYTLTPETLTIHDRFYPVTLRAAEVDVQGIRIVDLRQNTPWRPTKRTDGFANSHYQAGWFEVAGGQKVRLYRADRPIVVLFPPKGSGTPVLYQAADPEKFVHEIREEWGSVARRPAQTSANAGKWIYYAL
jgi:hypothetical protein